VQTLLLHFNTLNVTQKLGRTPLEEGSARHRETCFTAENIQTQQTSTLLADFEPVITDRRGTAVAQWLRCCATNRKVAGSTPASVSGFFIALNPSDRTMALGSTQPLTEMNTRSISWG